MELGCSTGSYLAKLTAAGWDAEGVEPDEAASEAARNAGFRVHTGVLDDVSLPEAFCDCAVAWMVIEHVPDPVATLRQLHDALKPGGQLIISVPNAGCWERYVFRSAWYGWEPPRHLHQFAPSRIRDVLKSAGFVSVRIVHQRNMLYIIGSLGIMLRRFSLTKRVGEQLLRYPEAPTMWVQLMLSPIAHLLALFRQAGRLTIEAERPGTDTTTHGKEQHAVKILFVSSGSRVPSSRFRILPYLRHFQSEGHTCVLANSFPQKYDYFPWFGFRPSQLLKRGVRWWHVLRAKIRAFDIVFIDREIFDNATTDMEERFKNCCRKFVLDLDDAVFLRHPEKFDRLLSMSDLVVCGNRFLIEKVEPANAHTLLVPTCVDMQDYGMRPDSGTDSIPVVGWMGTTGNLKYIEVAAAALRTVASEMDFEFRVVVPDITPLKAIDLSGVNVVHDPWDPTREVQQLQSFDVGIMPLFPDQEWDIYKCGLKLIQYLAVGVPGVAAPVGVNAEIIAENENGFLAQNENEWCHALRTLLANPEMRRDKGIQGRQTVEERYSVQANYPVLRNALTELIKSDS